MHAARKSNPTKAVSMPSAMNRNNTAGGPVVGDFFSAEMIVNESLRKFWKPVKLLIEKKARALIFWAQYCTLTRILYTKCSLLPSPNATPGHFLQQRSLWAYPYEYTELGEIQCHYNNEHTKRRLVVGGELQKDVFIRYTHPPHSFPLRSYDPQIWPPTPRQTLSMHMPPFDSSLDAPPQNAMRIARPILM